MDGEEDFFQALRAVVIHLIQHDESLYNELIPYLKPYDDGEWSRYTPEQKRQHIMQLRAYFTAGRDPVTKYFEAYPHKWSKGRFAQFLERLEAFHAELSHSAKV